LQRLAWLRDAVVGAVGAAEVVMIEGYAFGAGRAGGTTHAHALGELGGVVRVALVEAGVTLVEVPPARLKKWATGRGNAPKDEVVIAAARRFDPPPHNNNEADAAWLRDLGLARIDGLTLSKERAA